MCKKFSTSDFSPFEKNFETLAFDFLQFCYAVNKKETEKMILLEDKSFGNKNVFEFCKEVKINIHEDEEKHRIILHECFQNVVEQVWFGDYKDDSRTMYFFKFIVYFLFAPFLWIIYILCNVKDFIVLINLNLIFKF